MKFNDGHITVKVVGEISNNMGPSKQFAQTFVLKRQGKNNSVYVLSDVFNYANSEQAEPAVEKVADQETAESVEKEADSTEAPEVEETEATKTAETEKEGDKVQEKKVKVTEAVGEVEGDEGMQKEKAVAMNQANEIGKTAEQLSGSSNNVSAADNKEIFVGRLRYSVQKEQLKEHFEKYGEVKYVKLTHGYGKPNYGYVGFKDAESVKNVLENLVSL